MPLLINLQLEHDAEESLTEAPPTQVVGLTYSAGDNGSVPLHPLWLEGQKVMSIFRLQVFSENREDFPTQTSFLANRSNSTRSTVALVPSGPLLPF